MHIFKRLLILCALLVSALAGASCPPNYTTASGSITDTSGRITNFSVCYPATMLVNNNYNIYLTITRSGASGTTDVTEMCGHRPATGFNSIGVTETIGLATNFNNTFNACASGTLGQYLFSAGLGTGVTVAGFSTLQPTVTGTYSYAVACSVVNGVGGNLFLPINITVIDQCPTVTASNGTGCGSGNISGLVTGGTSPYLFTQTGASVGGPVSLDSLGNYSFGGVSGSFQYFAEDVAGCLSNVATVNVTDNPALQTGSVLYNMTAGVPTTQTIVVSGGTPPYTFNTVGAFPIINGSVSFNSLTNEFTFTQNVPGASRMTIQATDANGCVSNTRNIYFYSCASGNVVSAALGNNNNQIALIYAICYPPIVQLGQTFDITATVVNVNPEGAVPTGPFVDFIPDPTQLAFAPGLSFAGNGPIPPQISSFNPAAPSDQSLGGQGEIIYAPLILSGVSVDLQIQILATALGTQTYTARNLFNPGNDLVPPVSILVTPPCDITAGSTGINICNDVLAGNLANLVTGGTGALSFTGPISQSCPQSQVTIQSNGDFVYAAPSGFTGPCSFVYQVTDAASCSSTGSVTVVANRAPRVVDALIIPCANQSITESLAGLVFGDTQPPLTFAIVTQPSNGTISNFNPATGAYTYTPNAGFIGLDSFTFVVTNGNQCISNVGTISVDVISCCPVSSAPIMQFILQNYWGFTGFTGIS